MSMGLIAEAQNTLSAKATSSPTHTKRMQMINTQKSHIEMVQS